MDDGSRLVAGRYLVGALLGTGGSASVFAAVDTRTGDSLALKILHPHLSARLVARSAFLAEAARAEPLRHPNIVGVIGVGVDDSGGEPVAWIALERAAGSSLAEHVRRHGPLSPAEGVALADGVLRALKAAHAIGLIHRDVSPANIMVARGKSEVIDRDGVRLLDFGLAAAAGATAMGTDDLLSVEATGRAGVLGNVNYISPEQVRGEPVDERGDIYQTGGVVYFAVTGRVPFPRANAADTMRAHLDARPPVPSAIDARIPRALDRVVVRAMLKDPGERFASAEAMRAEILAIGPTSTAPDAARSASDDAHQTGEEVTRVLGITMVPARATATADLAAAAWRRRSHRGRPRAGAVFLTVTAAILAVIGIGVAATTVAPASVEAAPSSAPSPESTPPAQPTTRPVTAEPSPEPLVELTIVPDLGRQSVAEAVRALSDAGLTVGEISYVDSAFLLDTVLESRPAAGDSVPKRGPVALLVASGFNTVPDVAGLTRDAALAIVQAAGFVPGVAHRSASGADQPGRIVGTDPVPGSRIAVGEQASVLELVFTGPTPTPTRTDPVPTPTPTTEPAG